MREIKFREFDKNKGTMDEFIYDLNFKEDETHKEIHLYHDEILMQYTGLKDKNGVEIYEGDIVNYMYRSWNDGGMGDKIKTKEVKFREGGFNCFTLDIFGVEVIGNIYENKELLNG